jgi:hypothetical protein
MKKECIRQAVAEAGEVKLTQLFYLQLYSGLLSAERQQQNKQKLKQKQVGSIILNTFKLDLCFPI